jgi:ATP synthase protein I
MNSDSPNSAQAALIRPVIATFIAGIAGTVIGGIISGGPGVIAGIMATVVVLLFFGLGQLAVQKVLANNPALGLNAALGVYLGQIIALFLILLLLRDATFFAPKVFAATVAVCALVWTGMIVATLSQRPRAYVEPESTLSLSTDPDVVERLKNKGQ